MRKFVLAVIITMLGSGTLADYVTEFKDRVKAIEERFKEIDTRAKIALSTGSSVTLDGKPKFYEYAERRNEVVRFIPEPRKEILQARATLEQSTGLRLKAEQEFKVLLDDTEVDVNDDDSKPLPLTALMPRIETAIAAAAKELEEASTSTSEANSSVNDLRRKVRSASDDEKQQLQDELKKATEELSKARAGLQGLRYKRDKLKQAKEALARVIEYSNFLPDFETNVRRLEAVESAASQRIEQIDGTIFNYLLVQENDKRYTLYSTLVFGVAVVIVIGSFFFVAYKSEAVRNSIFANDSGLQFVTLFSLVIAIILFGVLKILEGRELAALLGGLSGYILGRGGITRQSAPANTPPGIPPQPLTPPVPQGPG